MNTKLMFLVLLTLVACGKEAAVVQTPPDPNRCPVNDYGSVNTIDFVPNGQLIVESGYCVSSGTYSCDSATKTLSLTVTAEQTGTLSANCLHTGTYSCSYVYTNAVGEFTKLAITCSGSTNPLNPTQTYTSFRTN